jgi:hypothetical protein
MQKTGDLRLYLCCATELGGGGEEKEDREMKELMKCIIGIIQVRQANFLTALLVQYEKRKLACRTLYYSVAC